MIIDGHVHTIAADGVVSDATVARLLALADRAGIDRMVHMFDLGVAPGPDPTIDEVRRSNDIGISLVRRHPKRFAAFCYLNPAHPKTDLMAEIDRCVVEGPARGIKLWISVHADDPRLDPIMKRAAKLKVPVLHHAWYKVNGFVHNESSPPEIATLARRHPKVPIVMAHLAGVGIRGLHDVADCPNVLVDTSGGQPHAGLVEAAVDILGPNRVVFGSDWPVRDLAVQRARVDGADLDDAEREAVLGITWQRLLDGTWKATARR
jgi:predicted TIM-barrel fold metal-dependent hydrolase